MNNDDLRKVIKIQLSKFSARSQNSFEFLEIKYNGEIRFAIKKTSIEPTFRTSNSEEFLMHKGSAVFIKYYLIDKKFKDIEFEYDEYEQIYTCTCCDTWEPIDGMNIFFSNNQNGISTKRVELCSECYKLFNEEYISSSEYKKREKYIKKEVAHLKKLSVLNNKELHGHTITILNKHSEGKNRIILEDFFSDGHFSSYSYRILKDWYHYDGLFTGPSCLASKCTICESFYYFQHLNYIKAKINGMYDNSYICDFCRSSIIKEYTDSNYYRAKKSRKWRTRIDSLITGNTSDGIKNSKVSTIEQYGNICILTGIVEDWDDKNTHIHLDHFIAQSTGHVGAVEGNLYPLNAILNISKSNSNPFDWILTRSDIDIKRWDNLIALNANHFGISIDEYRKFVDWCYSNPRDIRQIYLDGEKSSFELWLDSL